MNKTYLLFFGKSQNFEFHAFDSEKYIADFNSIIKDFDELESKYFTVEDISDEQILSKYNIEKGGTRYSLIKLYSFAQAYSGSRISGSIFGVALLSSKDLKISKTNIGILKAAKQELAKLSLDGYKFNTSNILPDAKRVWDALIDSNGVNYFNKIEYNSSEINEINNKIKGFQVQSVFTESEDLNKESENTSRMYFTDNLRHLLNARAKWGEEIFPVYIKKDGKYLLYKDPKPVPKPVEKPDPKVSSEELSRLRLRNGELKRELADAESDFKKFKDAAGKKLKYASILAIILGLTTITFFFKGPFMGSGEGALDTGEFTEVREGIEGANADGLQDKENLTTSSFDIMGVLGNDDYTTSTS